MKVVLISDTHCKHSQLEIPECDLLLHSGDFTNAGKMYELTAFAKWFGAQPAKHKIAIPGNHDFCTQAEPNWSRAQFAAQGTTLLIDEETVLPDGTRIYGSPWQPWFHNWAWNFHHSDPGNEARDCWERIPVNTDILLTHGPPYKVLDQVRNPRGREDPHVGCKYLLERVWCTSVRLHVFGHIHETRGICVDGSKTFVNASTVNLQHTKIREPYILEI